MELAFGFVILQLPLAPPKPVPVQPAGATPDAAPKVSVNIAVDVPVEQVTPTGGGGGAFSVVKLTGPAQTLSPEGEHIALT